MLQQAWTCEHSCSSRPSSGDAANTWGTMPFTLISSNTLWMESIHRQHITWYLESPGTGGEHQYLDLCAPGVKGFTCFVGDCVGFGHRLLVTQVNRRAPLTNQKRAERRKLSPWRVAAIFFKTSIMFYCPLTPNPHYPIRLNDHLGGALPLINKNHRNTSYVYEQVKQMVSLWCNTDCRLDTTASDEVKLKTLWKSVCVAVVTHSL